MPILDDDSQPALLQRRAFLGRSATGIGRSHLSIAAAALAAGGHLRVGMEDNLVYARGQAVQFAGSEPGHR